MEEALNHIDKRLSYYKKETAELLTDYLNEKDEQRKKSILAVRTGYEIVLSEIATIRDLLNKTNNK